jgi:TonB family protein
MGKLVKYCAKCEEGFAAKFGFCPNCGEILQAFEMNPVSEPIQSESEVENIRTESVSFETLAPISEAPAETAVFSEPEIIELDSADVPEEKSYTAEPASAAVASSDYFFDDGNDYEYDDYRPTVIEDKDTQLRNGLLITFASLVVSATMIAWVVSLFVHALPVSALSEEELFAYVGAIEDKPEKSEQEKKDDDEGGGGGGGGKERDRDANKGDLPNQSPNPSNYITPMERRDFDLVLNNTTEGPTTNKPLQMPTGLLNGGFDLSSGRGSGGGIGNGSGTGVGGGIGTGNEGYGSGRGGGTGNGVGGGTGNGGGGDDEPTIAKGVTSPVKILSRTQAKYTDAARQNNVQGSVTLRVTFTAAGTIGAISAVNSLPYGLTEQAIAAARQLRFEPAKRNGVAITTSKTVTFSFTIY